MAVKAQTIPRLPKWMMVVGWVVVMMGGLSALGLSIPVFDLESKTHAASTYATKTEVEEMSGTLREVRDNMIRLMERQGIQPVRTTQPKGDAE
jgi:hypothetical protein